MEHRARVMVSAALLIACVGEAPPGERTGVASGERSSEAPPRERSGEAAPGAPDASATVPAASWTVDFASYGPVPLGVYLAEADQAAGGLIDSPADLEDCGFARVRGAPEGVSLMVVNGVVARVDVREGPVRTERGAGIGDDAARIRELYPEGVEARPHKYTAGTYLITTPASGDPYRIVFETERSAVTRFRAGVLPEVEWVEGCS